MAVQRNIKMPTKYVLSSCALSLACMVAFECEAWAIDRDLARVINAVFVSETNYKLVMSAKSATACVLRPKRARMLYETAPIPYIEAESVDVSPELLAALKVELKNPAAYSIVTVGEQRKGGGVGATGCLPLYVVRIHFKSDKSELGVNFCFGCGDIALSRGEKIFHEANVIRRDAKFMELCLKLFPDHEGLKNLMAQREASTGERDAPKDQ